MSSSIQQLTRETPSDILKKAHGLSKNNITGSLKSTVIILDPSKRKKGEIKTGDSLINNEIDKSVNVTLLTEEWLSLLKQATEITETLVFPVNNSNPVAYDVTVEENIQKVKEAETQMQKLQMKFNYYKYYSFIWSFCALLLGVFLTAGVSGIVGPFSSFVGITMSLAGIIGGIWDLRDREKRNNA